MEPEYVAAKVIDGILRNKREIFIPASAASIDLFRVYVSLYLLLEKADTILKKRISKNFQQQNLPLHYFLIVTLPNAYLPIQHTWSVHSSFSR